MRIHDIAGGWRHDRCCRLHTAAAGSAGHLWIDMQGPPSAAGQGSTGDGSSTRPNPPWRGHLGARAACECRQAHTLHTQPVLDKCLPGDNLMLLPGEDHDCLAACAVLTGSADAAAARDARPAQAQGQQAYGQGAVPLMLPAPPLQEAADASSGQTQHFLNGALQPELGNGETQRAQAAEGMHQDGEGSAGLGAAPAQGSRPAVQKRGCRAQKAEQKAADRDRAQFNARRNLSAALLEMEERSRPASEGPAKAAARWLATRKVSFVASQHSVSMTRF